LILLNQKIYKMKLGLRRFTYYTTQAEDLLIKARREDNPAIWLYTNGARTPFFMLEALAKLYAGLHNNKKFDKLKNHFKLVEDGLGQIDYYDSLVKAFVPVRAVSSINTGNSVTVLFKKVSIQCASIVTFPV